MTDDRELLSLLPHRPPLRLLDGATMIDDGILVAHQTIPSSDDTMMLGHFPGYPIWPGALLLEAMAQTTALYLLHGRGGLRPSELPVLGATDVRFLQPVFPDEQISYRTRLVRRIGDNGLFSITATQQDGRVVARGRISAGIRPRSDLR